MLRPTCCSSLPHPGSGIICSGVSPNPRQGPQATPPPCPLGAQPFLERHPPVCAGQGGVLCFGSSCGGCQGEGRVLPSQQSPGRGCSSDQSRNRVGGGWGGATLGSPWGRAAPPTWQVWGRLGAGGGQSSGEQSESSKPGITQGLGERRKNNPDGILKHNYPLPPPACCDYTRRLAGSSRAPTLAPWHLHKECSPAGIIPVHNPWSRDASPNSRSCLRSARPPGPSPAPQEHRLSDPEQPKELLLFLRCHVPGSAPAKNTPNRAAAHLEGGSEPLPAPRPAPAPNYPLRLLLGRGADLQRGSADPGAPRTRHSDGAPRASLVAFGWVSPHLMARGGVEAPRWAVGRDPEGHTEVPLSTEGPSGLLLPQDGPLRHHRPCS